MLIFNSLVFEGVLTTDSATGVRSDPRFSEVMGAAETLHISGYSSQVSGAPTLLLYVEVSLDNHLWTTYLPIAPLLSQALNAGSETLFQTIYPNTYPSPPYMRVHAYVTGTNAQAYIRLFAT